MFQNLFHEVPVNLVDGIVQSRGFGVLSITTLQEGDEDREGEVRDDSGQLVEVPGVPLPAQADNQLPRHLLHFTRVETHLRITHAPVFSNCYQNSSVCITLSRDTRVITHKGRRHTDHVSIHSAKRKFPLDEADFS